MKALERVAQMKQMFGFDELETEIKTDLKTERDAGFDEGVAQNTTPGEKIYTEADLQAELTPVRDELAAVKAQLEEMQNAPKPEVPEDVTPFAQADIDAAVEQSSAVLKEKIAGLELELSGKDTDAIEEAIADELAALAEKMRARSVKSEPVKEAPVVTDPVIDAPVVNEEPRSEVE